MVGGAHSLLYSCLSPRFRCLGGDELWAYAHRGLGYVCMCCGWESFPFQAVLVGGTRGVKPMLWTLTRIHLLRAEVPFLPCY